MTAYRSSAAPTTIVDPRAGGERVADVLVVGGGQAAADVAHGLRRGGHEGTILMAGEESLPPYERPPLSKAALLGQLQPERLSLRGMRAYADLDVEVQVGARAVELDPEAHVVRFADDSVVRYGSCVLATGARAVPSPWPAGERIHAVRTFADAVRLRAAVAGGARTALVVGGGFLGLELASSLGQLGVDVALVEAGPSLLPGRTSAATADWLLARHRRHGLQVHLGCLVTELHESGDNVDVVLRDGTRLGVDLVVYAAGAVANLELAAAAGAACGRGILVDAEGRTSLTDVYAAGDVASQRTRSGAEARIESVHNAVWGAKAVVASLTGAPAVSPPVPTFWSVQAGIRLQQAGWLPPNTDTHDVVSTAEDELLVERYLAGALVAVEAVGRPVDYLRCLKSVTDLRFWM